MYICNTRMKNPSAWIFDLFVLRNHQELKWKAVGRSNWENELGGCSGHRLTSNLNTGSNCCKGSLKRYYQNVDDQVLADYTKLWCFEGGTKVSLSVCPYLPTTWKLLFKSYGRLPSCQRQLDFSFLVHLELQEVLFDSTVYSYADASYFNPIVTLPIYEFLQSLCSGPHSLPTIASQSNHIKAFTLINSYVFFHVGANSAIFRVCTT